MNTTQTILAASHERSSLQTSTGMGTNMSAMNGHHRNGAHAPDIGTLDKATCVSEFRIMARDILLHDKRLAGAVLEKAQKRYPEARHIGLIETIRTVKRYVQERPHEVNETFLRRAFRSAGATTKLIEKPRRGVALKKHYRPYSR